VCNFAQVKTLSIFHNSSPPFSSAEIVHELHVGIFTVLFATVLGIFTTPPYCNTKQPLVKVGYQQELDQVTAVPTRTTGRYINEISTQLVEALPYKPQGREFDCRWGQCVGLTTLPLPVADFLEILAASISCPGLYCDSLHQ